MKRVYKVKVSDFYIRAENKEQLEDILWERYGIEAVNIENIEVIGGNDYMIGQCYND